MKNTLPAFRNLCFLIFLSIIPMAAGMTVNGIIKGNVDFIFTYLDGVLWLAGGAIAYLAFKGTHELTFPKGKKPSIALMLSAFVFSFASVFIFLSYMLMKADSDPEMNVAKQVQAVLLAPFAEELLCRYMMTAVIKNNRKCFSIAAVIVTAFLWTVMHSPSHFHMIRLMISGIILSIIYQLTNNLSICILYHMANNLSVTAALFFGRSAGSVPIMAVSIVLTIISGIILLKEVRKKALLEGTVSKRVPSAAEGLTI